MSRRNNVMGPTSALTEFLRESGITATTIARRNRTRQEQATAGPSNAAQGCEGAQEAEQAEAGPSRSRTRRTTSGYASDELDEPEEEDESPKKKRKTTSAAAQVKAKEAAKKKAKKGKKGGDDDDYSDSGSDSYNALSKAIWANTKKPPVGSFEDCVRCAKQFTVTKYTMASSAGDGFLCHQCAKASGADPFKKPAAKAPPRKREKRNVVSFEERSLPSLVSLCVQLISKHIDEVEALGNLGTVNMSEIAKALCKNRTLTCENVVLFHDIQNTSLHLSDVTRLTPNALSALGSLNPNLTSLRLDFCGRIDDSVLSSWSTSLPALTRLELLGPFLVRAPAWQAFFASHPQLEGFLITQSPRFDVACVQALVEHCRGLRELRLREVGRMCDAFVEALQPAAEGLTLLDLSDPTASLTDEPLAELLAVCGPTLANLDLSGNIELTDTVLEGIHKHCRALRHLRLSNLPELTDAGLAALFSPNWANPALRTADFARDHVLSGDALLALLRHSGGALQALSVNSWKETPGEALSAIGEQARELRRLDVSWCREVDDFVVKAVLDGCERIEEIKVWGCNRITQACPRRKGANIRGVESHTI